MGQHLYISWCCGLSSQKCEVLSAASHRTLGLLQRLRDSLATFGVRISQISGRSRFGRHHPVQSRVAMAYEPRVCAKPVNLVSGLWLDNAEMV